MEIDFDNMTVSQRKVKTLGLVRRRPLFDDGNQQEFRMYVEFLFHLIKNISHWNL